MNLCTLFDSNYIDRALVMYDSLMKSCDDFTLYVIAFDSLCYQTLTELALPHMKVVPYEEFEDDTLRTAKGNRSTLEFLWTCSGYSIRYFIRRFDLDDLTYIDSDLFFYDSPQSALQRFLDSGYDAAIISHRYSKHPENEYNSKMYGQYCVQFNTFRNTPNGSKILDWWIDRCIETCRAEATDTLFGDQKYLDQFNSLFDGVYIYEDFGMGVAPWNVDDYIKVNSTATNGISLIKHRKTRETGPLVFYHFHSLDVFPNGQSNIRVFIRPGRHDNALIESLYKPYIKDILRKRKDLFDRFGLFDPNTNNTQKAIRDGELKTFLTCEPNILFLFRKIWRYFLYKQKDYMKV